MTSNHIKDVLLRHYYEKGRHWATTNFSGCGLHECDVLMVTEARMVYEYEVKVSYSDFLADFKKEAKHKRLQGIDEHSTKGVPHDDKYYLEWTQTAGRPNYFYYACPPDLIPVNKVPGYAGLVYVSDTPTVVKKAPRLHGHKCKDGLILQIARQLTARNIFGCSFMNYKRLQSGTMSTSTH